MDTQQKNEKNKNEKSVFLREIRESLRLLIIVTSKSTVWDGNVQ